MKQTNLFGDNIARDKIEHINNIKLEGNNNVIIQGVDTNNTNITVNVPFEDFVEKYTKEKDREIDSLYKNISELRQLDTFKSKEIQEKQTQLEQLEAEKETIENQVKELIEKAEKTDFSEMSGLYQQAYQAFFKGNIDVALEILNEAKLQEQEQDLQERHKQEDKQLAQNRILRAELLVLKAKFDQAEKNFEIALKLERSVENLYIYMRVT